MKAVKHKDKAVEIKQAKSTWSVLSPANGAYENPKNLDTTEAWDELDKAVRYTFVGRYKDAQKILTREFIAHRPHKYVEACALYKTTGEWCTFVKDNPPLMAPIVTKPKGEGSDIWDLITLQAYHAGIIASGVLRQPLRFVRNFSLRHLKRNVEDFTGIDVQCLLECHRIVLIGKEQSNWRDIGTILPSLSKVRIHLQEKKLYSEAQSLLQTEVLVQEYDESSQDNPYESFLEATVHLELSNDEATLIKMAQVRLDYAEQLVGWRKHDAAVAEIQRAGQLMLRAIKPQNMGHRSVLKERGIPVFSRRRTTATTRYLHDEYPKLVHQSRKCHFLMNDYLSFEQKKQANHDLVDFALVSGDMLQYRSHLLTAYELSLPVDAVESQVPRTFEESRLIVNKIVDLDKAVLQLAYLKGGFLSRYVTDCSNRPKEELKDLLKLFEKFEEQHPKFELPSSSRSMSVRCAQLNHLVGKEERADLYFAQVEFWSRHTSKTQNTQERDGNLLKTMVDNELFETSFETTRTWSHFMLWCCYVIIKWTEITMQGTINPVENVDRLLCLDKKFYLGDSALWWEHSDSAPVLGDPQSKLTGNDEVSLTLPATLMGHAFGGHLPQTPQNWNAWFLALHTVVFRAMPPHQKFRLLILTQMCRIWKLLSHADEVPSVGKESFNILLFKECENVNSLAMDMSRRFFGKSSVLITTTSMLARATIRMVLASDMIEGENISGSYFSRAVDNLYLASKPFDQNSKMFAATLEKYVVALGLAYAEWGKQRSSKKFNASVTLFYFSEADSVYQRYRLSRMLSMEDENIKTSNFDVIQGLPIPEEYSKLAVIVTARGLSQLCPIRKDGHLNLIEEATIHSAKELIDEATKWIQKVKTRPLEKLLRNYIDLPGYVLPCFSRDAEILRTWNTRKSYWGAESEPLIDAQLSHQLRNFYNHDTIVKNLVPDLSPYLSIHEATRANPKELRLLMESWGPSVVVLVYIEARCLEYDWLVFIYRQTLLLCVAPIRTLRVHELKAYLDATKIEPRSLEGGTKSDTKYHNMLRPLIVPLQDWIEPQDSLIICPAPSLYRVPLQLLLFPVKTSDEAAPLIKRYSVTYAQTFSLLNICQLSQQGKLHCSSHNANASFEELPYFEERLLHMTCQNVTTTSSETNGKGGSYSIYLYKQGLRRPQSRTNSNQKSMLSSLGFINLDKIPATELLKLRFPGRPNILFVTRDWSEYEENDDSEHLIQIAALHVSGAGSIISTLRPVPEECCKRFLDMFHKILADAITDAIGNAEKVYIGKSSKYINDDWVTTCFVNLAQVLQKTIICLLEQDNDEQSSIDRWADFVLHGAHKLGLLRKLCTYSDSS